MEYPKNVPSVEPRHFFTEKSVQRLMPCFDKPAVSPVEPHERDLPPFDELRANGLSKD